MSMCKAIKAGKEHRKEYRGAKAVDCSCRNHGTCTYCRDNRLYKFRKAELRIDDESQREVFAQ